MKNLLKVLYVIVFSFMFALIISSCGDNTNTTESSSNTPISEKDNISDNNEEEYTITFKNYDGTVLQTLRVKKDVTPQYEGNTPTKQKDDNGSYIFDDWEPSLAPATKNQIYTAKYRLESKLTVTFDANGGEFDNINPHEFSVYKGEKIASPVSPIKTNYKFIGWTKTKDDFDYWDFSTDVVNDNITLYAKWEVKEAVILSVEGSYIDNNVIYMTISKDIDSVPLSNMVITSNNSYWKLYYDKLGQTEIPTKIAASKTGELNDGDNEFYIVVISSNGLQTNTYKLIIHRSYKIRIDFYDYSTVIHSEYAYSGYEYEIIYKPEITGYTFEYWSYNDEQVEKIVPMGNVDIMAIITANHYTIEFDSNGGNKLDNIEVEYGRYYSTPIPEKTGYTFLGWECDNELIVYQNGDSTEKYLIDENSKFVAKWQVNQYTISVSTNNSDAGTVSGSGTYDYNSSITLKATTNPGYTFIGWYKNNKLYAEYDSFDYIIGVEIVVFEARYIANKYSITIVNHTTGVSITGVTSGNEYEFDSEITLIATNIPYGYTIEWSRSDDVAYKGNNYTFNVPAYNLIINITTSRPYTRYDNKIYFGTYPQTEIEATETNGLLSIAYDSTWISYKYISSSQTDYMYYKDIDIDNNGTLDFRGVYFTQYRPSDYSLNESSHQYSNGYEKGKIYWFSYDPIEWNILKLDGDKALIIANLILDSQEYYPSTSTSSFSHNGGTGYASNYELSNIRKFLNDTFYNVAFNDLQKAIIETTKVDNTEYSANTISKYACNNTNDKLFLLSYREVVSETNYQNEIKKQVKGTDYAKCQNLFVSTSSSTLDYSCWYLRSPYKEYGYFVYYIGVTGIIAYAGCQGTSGGVRPVCWINV